MKNKIKNFVDDHRVELAYFAGAATGVCVIPLIMHVMKVEIAHKPLHSEEGWVAASISPEFATWIRSNPPIPWEN